MQLPRSLTPWSSYLSLLAAPLPWSLGPTIKTLDLVFGPSRIALSADSDDEPEGYDGIARKGTYERLVLSEWLLADEFPEEFIRRSSVGEHAFLELSRRSPTGRKRTTILFDCGPNQLGSPRVAHLAILIVLARRADQNDMDVEWGILQDAGGTLVQGASKESIELLLSSRTVHEVTDKDVDRWFETVSDKNVVIVGGARLSKITRKRKMTLLTVEDVLEPGEQALTACFVASEGNRKSQFRLPLPAEQDCVKILENPFEDTGSEQKKKQQKQEANDWSLIASGEVFLLRQSASSLLSLRVSPTAQSRGIQQQNYSLSGNAALVASGANVTRATLAAITASGREQFQIVLIGGAGVPSYYTHHLYGDIDLPHSKRPGWDMTSIFPSPRKDPDNEYVWVRTDKKILEIPSRAGSVRSNLIAGGVLWLTSSRATIRGINQPVLVYARESQNSYYVVIVGLETNEQEVMIIPGRPMFCSPSQILIAYRDERLATWSFATYPPTITVVDSIHDRQFLHGELPIATITAGHFSTTMTGLLTISKDRRDLHIVSSGAMPRLRLPQSTSTIHSVAVNQDGVVAYMTDRVLTVVWPDGEWQPFVFDGQRFNSQWGGD